MTQETSSTAESFTRRPRRLSVAAAAAAVGAVAGLIDIESACLINGASYPHIARIIAGGLLGSRTFALAAAPIFGVFLQMAMAIVIAFIFVIARRVLAGRLARPGVVLGGAVATFVVMNYVVLPLSAWRRVPAFTPEKALLNLLAMILFSAILVYGTDAAAALLARRRA